MANLQMLTVLALATTALAQECAATGKCLIVSLADRKLALVENGQVVKIYRTAVGAGRSPSPTGTFVIVHRISNPAWYRPGKVVPPGKNNPLGTRWIGLSEKGYGIHGTNEPDSIGKPASHGCIRMRNSDVEDLFKRVSLGDRVELYAELPEQLKWVFVDSAPVAVQAGGR